MLQSTDQILNKISFLIGDTLFVDTLPLEVYSSITCNFLNELSALLLKNKQAKLYSDVITFAFWCRKSNIKKLKDEFTERLYGIRTGLGLAFTIAPSNVPVNFAYSFAFSLLAGNANIIRVPSKESTQAEIILQAIRNILNQEQFSELLKMNVFIKYSRDIEITSYISLLCNARIIWGGDTTICTLRKAPTPPRCVEIAFADRYSICCMNASCLCKLSGTKLSDLANDFYNDTYLMDQNACNSPHVVFWTGKNGKCIQQAKDIFWEKLYAIAKNKYDLPAIKSLEKYTQLCNEAIEYDNLKTIKIFSNYLYLIQLQNIPKSLDTYRGKFGYFYEINIKDINEIAPLINEKYQTLTYYGLSKNELRDFILQNRLKGIDRIVPVGKSMNISTIWDGYDLIERLSKICDIK